MKNFCIFVLGLVFLSCTTGGDVKTTYDSGSNDALLKERFAAVKKETVRITLDGQQMEVNAWRKLTYAANPVDVDLDKTIIPPWLNSMTFDSGAWQQISIFAPQNADANSPI
ncbi:MAG: hypothetical protein LBK83_01400, partial [Treponema sp.]|nr:hypothetical protein [Treponema sp.]